MDMCFLVMNQGVNVLQGECSSWRTVLPSSGVYAELPPVLLEAPCMGSVWATRVLMASICDSQF